MPTKTDRERYVNEQVSLWLINDGDHYFVAQAFDGDLDGLARYVRQVLTTARRPTAPWQVAQELEPGDFERIDWAALAADLREE